MKKKALNIKWKSDLNWINEKYKIFSSHWSQLPQFTEL